MARFDLWDFESPVTEPLLPNKVRGATRDNVLRGNVQETLSASWSGAASGNAKSAIGEPNLPEKTVPCSTQRQCAVRR